MALFGKKSEGGLMDVIRCDETDYLIWKWRPSGEAGSTSKENAIRWGSSLRVKDGEVAAFVYKQKDGTAQDFIEGPFDETIKTANFPVLANIMGLAYAGQAPFQAEVYFINLAGNIRLPFGVPFFDVADPRFLDFPVKVSARGSLVFTIQNYRSFIKLHRLINFDLNQFKVLVRDAMIRYVKSGVVNAPADHGLPVLQIERKLDWLNETIGPRIGQAFATDFGVHMVRFDLEACEVDKESEEYRELRNVSANLETVTRQQQAAVGMRNLDDTQRINAENMSESLAVQRRTAEQFQTLQTEQQFITAHQINRQADVLERAADSLGSMGTMNLGGGGGGNGGGFNPVGMMTGLALGGAMGNQMASMATMAGQAIQQPQVVPPPPPRVQFNVQLNGQNAGPFDLPQLSGMVRAGQIARATFVWKAGMANWTAASDVPELASLFTPEPPPLRTPVSYHVVVAGQNQGPLDWGQLEALKGSGELTQQSHVWKQGMQQWQQAGAVDELAPLFADRAGPPPVPPFAPPPPPGA
jgi:membrane protease subunit (stomatin/prohibitin family)